MPAALELRDIRKSFGATDIIKGVDLTVASGEFLVFVGPSGCGKSTLLRMIAGLEDISSGQLLFDGVTVNDWSPAQRRIGMVFQSYALYPHMSVEENIGFSLKLAKMPKAEMRERVEQAMRTLQLTGLRNHKPSQLSGGQRQRVAIGRAIVRNPNVFLFDEPLSNLDAALRGQMRMEIGKLHQQLKNTVIYVTHDQVEAMTLADRIVVFEGGVIRQVGTPMELYNHPANRFVASFIGSPTMGFLSARVGGSGPEGVDIVLGDAKLRIGRRARLLPQDAPVTLGIRPEHVKVGPANQGVVDGRVVMLERLGADSFAFFDVPGADSPIAARLDPQDTGVAVGEILALRFDPGHVHLFDADGNNLPTIMDPMPITADLACLPPASVRNECFRPQYHFTPHRNWINDPNGLVYYEGEYHLFFQHNPKGKDWGNMSWGHAVSADLLHWRELPIAIGHTDAMTFSGSVIVDWHNQSGLGDGINPPLLAYFTSFDANRNIQSQHLAYSHDRGRSFTHYAGNPIIDLGAADFRDPKVFYHAPSAAWVMAVVRARAHAVLFYRSTNLRDWALAGTFSGLGATTGQWECPDLLCLRHEGVTYWVLKIDVDAGLVDGGSGAQYFVGNFDGFTFAVDPRVGDPQGALVDYGPDFYAAMSWSDLPTQHSDPVWVGWQSNHQTGKNYPTDPWRGAMSLPRSLFLFAEGQRLRLGQRPLETMEGLRGGGTALAQRDMPKGSEAELPMPRTSFVLHIDISDHGSARVAVTLADEACALATLDVDFAAQSLCLARHASPLCPDERFARSTQAPLPVSGAITLEIFFDGSLLEIFADDGRRVWSACLFPSGGMKGTVRVLSGSVRLGQFEWWPMAATMGGAP